VQTRERRRRAGNVEVSVGDVLFIGHTGGRLASRESGARLRAPLDWRIFKGIL
jgi:hypothetical protein